MFFGISVVNLLFPITRIRLFSPISLLAGHADMQILYYSHMMFTMVGRWYGYSGIQDSFRNNVFYPLVREARAGGSSRYAMINNRLGFALKLKDDGNYQLIIEYFIS
jgi:hypothetical protein